MVSYKNIPEVSQAVYSLEKRWLVLEFSDNKIPHIYMEGVLQFENNLVNDGDGNPWFTVNPLWEPESEIPSLKIRSEKGSEFYTELTVIS